MATLRRTLTDGATYRRFLFLVSAIPLGQFWFVALVTGWSLCLALAITPLVIPLLIGLAAMTRGFAAIEAAIARALLEIELRAPAVLPPGGGFWARFRALLGADFWRAQAYLLIRWFMGFPLGVALLSLLAAGLALSFAPMWLPFVHGGAHLGFWRPHTFAQSLALVPAGLVVLSASLLVVAPIAGAFRAIASALLARPAEPGGRQPTDAAAAKAAVRTRRGLEVHAAVDATVLFGLVVIWALTSRSYFWPVWVALPLAVALGIHGWFVLITERPSLVRRFRGSRTLAATVGVAGVGALFFIAIWAITARGYFWPVWPILAITIVVIVYTAVVLLSPPGQAELAERIETLESTRAGAIDVQDSELRRIERDLHDGAQARLVALGMSLGMAEHKLSDDPEEAGKLLAEARVGAEHALRELRDLARGIHPPVLGDRGLEAAIAALASSTPMQVSLSVSVAERPAPAVESAAYFVAAEALANATKHARATRLDIHVERVDDALELEVKDDGVGGADAGGSGLRGLRRRVEALDGTLSVTSPSGGPTTIRAELPCG